MIKIRNFILKKISKSKKFQNRYFGNIYKKN